MIPRSGISFVSGNGTLIARCSKSPGLYSSEMFELTVGNVDLVLEDVRPYLISDGGNVEVVSVEDGIISLRLQGLRINFLSVCYIGLPLNLRCYHKHW